MLPRRQPLPSLSPAETGSQRNLADFAGRFVILATTPKHDNRKKPHYRNHPGRNDPALPKHRVLSSPLGPVRSGHMAVSRSPRKTGRPENTRDRFRCPPDCNADVLRLPVSRPRLAACRQCWRNLFPKEWNTCNRNVFITTLTVRVQCSPSGWRECLTIHAQPNRFQTT